MPAEEQARPVGPGQHQDLKVSAASPRQCSMSSWKERHTARYSSFDNARDGRCRSTRASASQAVSTTATDQQVTEMSEVAHLQAGLCTPGHRPPRQLVNTTARGGRRVDVSSNGFRWAVGPEGRHRAFGRDQSRDPRRWSRSGLAPESGSSNQPETCAEQTRQCDGGPEPGRNSDAPAARLLREGGGPCSAPIGQLRRG
jgi:hypothetical protein